MDYLLDSGVLLRLVEKTDPQYPSVTQAVDLLQTAGHRLITARQNVSEYWNVSTRPLTARGGYGLSIEETDRRLGLLERSILVLPEPADTYAIWRHLVVDHRVSGTKVHDARLAAMLLALGHTHLLTLNASDFRRYPGIVVVTPQDVLNNAAP